MASKQSEESIPNLRASSRAGRGTNVFGVGKSATKVPPASANPRNLEDINFDSLPDIGLDDEIVRSPIKERVTGRLGARVAKSLTPKKDKNRAVGNGELKGVNAPSPPPLTQDDPLKNLIDLFESKGYIGKEAVEKAEAEIKSRREHELQMKQTAATATAPPAEFHVLPELEVLAAGETRRREEEANQQQRIAEALRAGQRETRGNHGDLDDDEILDSLGVNHRDVEEEMVKKEEDRRKELEVSQGEEGKKRRDGVYRTSSLRDMAASTNPLLGPLLRESVASLLEGVCPSDRGNGLEYTEEAL
jgi:hypothetical protein